MLRAAKLREIERRAAANGVPDVQWLDAVAIRDLEPEITGQAALLSPTTATSTTPRLPAPSPMSRLHSEAAGTRHACDLLAPPGGRPGGGQHALACTQQLSRLVICAGLQSDLLATEAGDEAAPEIVPFRGEYLRLRPHARGRVRHLIYPVPDPAYPFLGVHLTPRIDGEVDIGPNAVLALAREGYRRRDVSRAQLSRLARSGAFRRLARRTGGRACARCAGRCRGRLSSPRPAPTCPGWAPAT